jgi:hypothetical protein
MPALLHQNKFENTNVTIFATMLQIFLNSHFSILNSKDAEIQRKSYTRRVLQWTKCEIINLT